ncbi:hypothetical protein N0V88_007505 [Collariella sp. IMI 366227]|nr:hypothetical protein N0V88_007505 [Collariella sp. IMI 366227]
MVMTSALHDGVWGDVEALGIKVSSPPVICREARNDAVHVWAREDAELKLIRHNYWEDKWDRGAWPAGCGVPEQHLDQ